MRIRLPRASPANRGRSSDWLAKCGILIRGDVPISRQPQMIQRRRVDGISQSSAATPKLCGPRVNSHGLTVEAESDDASRVGKFL